MKAKLERALPLICATMMLVILVGTVAAANGWFQFIYSYEPIEGGYLEQTDTFTISESPDVPQYVNASMIIVGSGFVNHPHEVYINVSHNKPDPDPSNYWVLECNVRAYLEESDETISEYQITSLSGDGFDLNFGEWTPTSPPFPYTLILNVTDYAWTNLERGNATYVVEDVIKTVTSSDGATGALRGVVIPDTEVPIGSQVEMRFEYSTTIIDPASSQYQIIDNGVVVIPWTDVPTFSVLYTVETVLWTAQSPAGPHIVEILLHTER